MIFNEKVVSYKVLDLAIRYNYDINFDFIRDRMKILLFFCMILFVGGESCHHLPLNIHY